MSMLVDPPSIKAICHRASCGYKYTNGEHHQHSMHDSRPSRVRPYTGELQALDAADLAWLAERFQTNPHAFVGVRKSETRYFLPITGPEGVRRGWVSRKAWEGSPAYYASDERPKALVYMDTEEPVQSWHGVQYQGAWGDQMPRVIVEDQISAMRLLWDTGLHSIAIIGTGVNEEKIAELQRHAKHIVFALDADATGQAFAHARKWGQAFESCRVVILRRDIKDELPQTVREIFAQITPAQ
jgi:hypothetical protein